ncbi:MAG: hypothetical protein ACI9JE_000668, partial [Candidatus Krumholzibacteriia bacterium]
MNTDMIICASPKIFRLGILLIAIFTSSLVSASTMSEQQRWYGEVVADQFGIAMSPIGDVNGDYREDFLVGANVNDAQVQSGGRAYLYLGGTTYPSF